MSDTDAPETEAPAPAAPAEFPTDEHRSSHIGALKHEKDGYEARAKAFAGKGDTSGEELAKARAGQVQDELNRLAGEAKPASRRAERRG